MHPFFHVSLLRQEHGNPIPIPLSPQHQVDEPDITPNALLQHCKENNSANVFVKQDNWDTNTTTWEPFEYFQICFPESCASSPIISSLNNEHIVKEGKLISVSITL